MLPRETTPECTGNCFKAQFRAVEHRNEQDVPQMRKEGRKHPMAAVDTPPETPSFCVQIMDPLLPYGVLLTCLEAYADPADIGRDEPLLSPNSAPDDLLVQVE
jgi:hypothetical protein